MAAIGRPPTIRKETHMRLARNVGPVDRILRLALAAMFLAVAIAGVVTGPVAAGALVIAAILLVTGATGVCPLYALLGLSTCPVRR
jgi:hypothetical protein